MAKGPKNEGKVSRAGKEVQAPRPARGLSPFEDMDRWFEGVFPRGWMRPFRGEWPAWAELHPHLDTRMPKVDVIDRDEEVVVHAEMPGVEKDDLDVSVSDNAVTIKGETRHEERQEKGDYFRSEISHGTFTRTVALPDYVDSSGAKAKFKDGVLELTLPKVEKARRRNIRIE